MVLRVVVSTPWFPNVPGDREGQYVYESAATVALRNVSTCILVTRPWLRTRLGQQRYRSLSGSFTPDAFPAFAEVKLVHYPSIPGNRLPRIASWLHDRTVEPALETLCRAYRPDLIHAHTEGEAPAAIAVGKKLRLPVVVTLHGINIARRYFDSAFRRERFRSALTAADRIILVGVPLQSYFTALLGHLDTFRIVPNGFKPPNDAPIVPFANESEMVFVSVSNLHEGKGMDIALQALAKARSRGLERFRYTIVGDGFERAGWEALTNALGLADRVHFAGACPHSKVYEVLQQGDVFLLPSYREAFGVAYLEAMAAGLLAIGVQGQGPSAFIRDGETGFLVPPRDADSLADVLLAIAAQPARMRAIASAGTAHVRDNLTWTHHARELHSLYEEVARR